MGFVKLFACTVIALLMLPTLAGAKQRKASPHLSVAGWSTQAKGGSTIRSGETLRLCGAVAERTKTLYVRLNFRGMRKGRVTTVKWTVNGLTYARAEQKWALPGSGKATSDLNRASAHTRFLSGVYRFSFLYGNKRLVTSTLNVETNC